MYTPPNTNCRKSSKQEGGGGNKIGHVTCGSVGFVAPFPPPSLPSSLSLLAGTTYCAIKTTLLHVLLAVAVYKYMHTLIFSFSSEILGRFSLIDCHEGAWYANGGNMLDYCTIGPCVPLESFRYNRLIV